MIKKRGKAPSPAAESPVVPTLPDSVPADALWVDSSLAEPRDVTGARWGFDDYAVGERIDHYDAMAVNPSDHMAFTRLFQNSAKVHFDAHGMNGQPLVYGGVVISHAYAIAYNGLESRLGIVAINAGAHANPTYAGDTLYAWSEVLETHPIDDRVGALRVRTVAVKNHDPAAEPIPLRVEDPKRPGKTAYHPAVVLDLDYWELVAR
jgi:2-methylfumaryl-CoA hydratase